MDNHFVQTIAKFYSFNSAASNFPIFSFRMNRTTNKSMPYTRNSPISRRGRPKGSPREKKSKINNNKGGINSPNLFIMRGMVCRKNKV
ncbi:hypothetical protein OAS1_06110 [Bacillus sp. YKCMOAS1]|nr:hypothetical protein OAS1_06110 [Bacillus sp. YKCMOAS1]